MKTQLATCFFLLAALSGCTREVELRTPLGDTIGMANLELVGHNDGNAQLVIGDAHYRGSWSWHKVDESGRIAARYGINSRRYQAYSLGRAAYLKQGVARLVSDSGDELLCTFNYRSAVAHGSCTSAQHHFEFVAEEQAV